MVKSEIYGTRPSQLFSYLNKLSNITLFSGLWFITAIKKINPNPRNRYLFIKECLDRDSFFTADFQCIRPFIKDSVPLWFVCVEYHHALLEWEMTPFEEITLTELKRRIIRTTRCKFIRGQGKRGKRSSPFSRFFRSKLGGGFSLTDLDFILVGDGKLVIIEEKTFVDGDSGLLGYGQCESFREILNDTLDDTKMKAGDISWFLTFVLNNDLYVYDVLKQGLNEKISIAHHKWGNMIEFPMKEMKHSSIVDFVEKIKKNLLT